VLIAMGFEPAVAQTAVRFSFDAATTAEQLHEVAERLREAVLAVRAVGAASRG
jgi:cysteine desulfurase